MKRGTVTEKAVVDVLTAMSEAAEVFEVWMVSHKEMKYLTCSLYGIEALRVDGMQETFLPIHFQSTTKIIIDPLQIKTRVAASTLERDFKITSRGLQHFNVGDDLFQRLITNV